MLSNLTMPRSTGELEKIKAVDLRKMAAEMMRENSEFIWLHNGIEQTAGWVHTNGKKDDLVKHISMWEGQAALPKVEPKEETAELSSAKSPAGLLTDQKVTELRKMAADMMRENPSLEYLQHGIPQTASWVRRNGKKVGLLIHISQWEEQLKQLTVELVTEVEPVVEPVVEEEPVVQVQKATKKASKRPTKARAKAPTVEPVVEPVIEPPVEQVAELITDTPYQDSEAEKFAIAKKLYYSTEKNDELTGLREYQLNLCRTGKYFLPEFGILVARARVIIESHADANSLEGKAHPGTVQKIRVDVMKYLKQLVIPEVDKFLAVNDRTLEDTYNDFENAVRGAFKDIGAIKYKINQERSHKAEEDVRAIKVLPYLEWAIAQVSNLPANSARWKEVAIAIMLLTGRRQSEVLATGRFTHVDESTVIFEGQLKRHIAELVEAEKIPVLGKSAKQVVEAIKWLEEQGKRTLPTERSVEALQLAAKLSHNRCSRYIAETMEKLADKCQITNDKDWEAKEGNKMINKFKGHLNRQIYAQICSALFNDSNERKKRAFISRILLENRDAALSYDRDVEVVDIADVRELCGTFSE